MAKKKKTNKLGQEFVGVVGGKNIYRDAQYRFTDEEGKAIEETLPGYAKFLSTIFPEVYESGEKQRKVFQEDKAKLASEEKRDKAELRLEFESIEEYIRDNNTVLKEQLAELAQSSTLLSEISEKIGKMSSGSPIADAISGLTGLFKTFGGLRGRGAKPGGAKPSPETTKPGGAKTPPEKTPSGKPKTPKLNRFGKILGGAGALLEGYDVYKETGSAGQAVAAGGGALAGGIAGAELGAGVGLLTGPAAPVAVPVLSFLGGATGAALGSEAGQKLFGSGKESAAVQEAKQRGSKGQNVISFKAEEIRFNAQRLTFDVQKLTIESKGGESSISSGGARGGGGGGGAGPQAAFNPTIKTPDILGTTGGTGAYTGFTKGGPSAQESLNQAMKFQPSAKFAGATGNSLKELIDAAAAQAGIDPRMMYGIVAGESFHSNTYDVGDGGKSFGPFQMYTGGGLGNTFFKETGLDVRDPATLPQQAMWIANFLAKTPNGIRNWHGYRGNTDWNPSWGSMGFQQQAKVSDTTTRPISAGTDIATSLLSPTSIGSNAVTLTKPEAGAGFNLSLQTGTGMTLDARKAATDVGEKLKGRGSPSFENTEPGFSGAIGNLVPRNKSPVFLDNNPASWFGEKMKDWVKDQAASRDFNNFDWSFGENPPVATPAYTPRLSEVLSKKQTVKEAMPFGLGGVMEKIFSKPKEVTDEERNQISLAGRSAGARLGGGIITDKSYNAASNLVKPDIFYTDAGAYGDKDYGTWNPSWGTVIDESAYSKRSDITNFDRYVAERKANNLTLNAEQEFNIRGTLPKPSTDASAIDPVTGLKQGPGQVTPAAKLYPQSDVEWGGVNLQTGLMMGAAPEPAKNKTPIPRNPPLVAKKVDKHVDSKTAKPKSPGVVGGDDDMIRRVFEILGTVALGYAAYQGLHYRIGRVRR